MVGNSSPTLKVVAQMSISPRSTRHEDLMGDEGVEPPTLRCKRSVMTVSPIALRFQIVYASKDFAV